jgi:AcrR family transcriptional regulator
MNPDSPRPARRPRLRQRLKEAARGAILDAAETVFARDGLSRARMEDVAAGAGVAIGTLYNYFADRDALVDALLRARQDQLAQAIDAALADKRPFARRLEAFIAAVIDHFRAHLGLFPVHMEAELIRRAAGKPSRPLDLLHGRATLLVQSGVVEGVLDPTDAGLLPSVLMGMLKALFIRQKLGAGQPPADAAARLAHLFLHGAVIP